MYYADPDRGKDALVEITKANLKADKRHRKHDIAINALEIKDAVQSDQIKTMMKRLERLEKKPFTGPKIGV